jgi:hypothetical protein
MIRRGERNAVVRGRIRVGGTKIMAWKEQALSESRVRTTTDDDDK